MKGAIEYLRAVRDICADRDCDECPIYRLCPWTGSYPNCWDDEHIVAMVKHTGKMLEEIKKSDL